MPQSDQCLLCAHYRIGMHKCDAFPEGIPVEIFTGLVDHSKPYPGDHGIQFKAYEGDDELP